MLMPFDSPAHVLPAPAFASILHRIRAEFLEMPGLRLTTWQASRLWHLDAGTCEAVLEALVFEQFLQCTAAGAYVRADRR
jgi:hypothetical protein